MEGRRSFLVRLLLGDTRTRQVSGSSKRVVRSRKLSKKIYHQIDKHSSFVVQENGKKYNVVQLGSKKIDPQDFTVEHSIAR